MDKSLSLRYDLTVIIFRAIKAYKTVSSKRVALSIQKIIKYFVLNASVISEGRIILEYHYSIFTDVSQIVS